MAGGSEDERMPFQVIYLTGAPAAGKSSLGRALVTRLDPCQHIEYGAELTKKVQVGTGFTQAELRAAPSRFVSPAAVAQLDEELMERVTQSRGQQHIVFDSHAVTRERYGFRITGFAPSALLRLAPTMVLLLHLRPDLAMSRVRRGAEGRLEVSEHEAATHGMLQAQVAVHYALFASVPLHVLDGALPTSELADRVIAIVKGTHETPTVGGGE